MSSLARLAERLEVKGVAIVAVCLRRLSLPALQYIGKWFARTMWVLLPKRRRASIERIEQRLPELAPDRRTATALAKVAWEESGRSYLEFFHAHAFDASQLGISVRMHDPDAVRRFIANQRAVVVITAHFGSWELLTGIFGSAFADSRPRIILARMHKRASMRELMIRQRKVRGVRVVDKKGAAPLAGRLLAQNGLVAFLADVNAVRDEAVFAPFLGKTASVSKGPAVLAIQAKALVWPVFLARSAEGKWTHTLYVQEPLDAAALTGSVDDKIMEISAFATQAIEKVVRAHPTQWYWLPNRWKTRPERD